MVLSGKWTSSLFLVYMWQWCSPASLWFVSIQDNSRVLSVCFWTSSQGLSHHGSHNVSKTFVTELCTGCSIKVVVYGEFSYEVFGFCLDMGISLISLCIPYVLLAVKSYLFYLCCSRDPGTLTKANHTAQLKVYQYDEKLFQQGVQCSTCQLVKPARSKHCRVCNRCVQRFDHHCVWVNNCIGAQNTRYFLLYLLSVCAMACDIAVLTTDMLLQAVLRTGLLHAHYIDEQGVQQPAGPFFIIQHLFMTFPRIVFMLGFLVFVFFLLAGYSMFHMYLALINQTSNEWFKGKGYNCQHCHPHSGHSCRTSYNPFRGFYHRGILKNLGEIFWPLCPVQKKEN
ncbi:Palmitoyltransferase ZDHHC4 [Labeo rohita]|uniref:Palmitoyltransferase n=1 Tax=Labeo rohita TaxID=84645 RepID=A0ABQ8M6M0_LABRO|nr:Palmitoyltransferase ZDHHC4 [Labeo rohita]